MITFIIVIHIVVCVILIALVLVQAGKGGGLGGLFGGGGMSQSLFGVRTGTFLTRLTTVLAIIFMLTSLSLAVFYRRPGKSVMEGVRKEQVEGPKVEEEAAQAEGAEETPFPLPPVGD